MFLAGLGGGFGALPETPVYSMPPGESLDAATWTALRAAINAASAAAYNAASAKACGWGGNLSVTSVAPFLQWVVGAAAPGATAVAEAAAAYQWSRGLAVDGKIGPKTLTAVRSEANLPAPKCKAAAADQHAAGEGTQTPISTGPPWRTIAIAAGLGLCGYGAWLALRRR